MKFSEFEKLSKEKSPSRSGHKYPEKCMRTVAPNMWNHKNMYRDVVTVGVWCGCPECLVSLNRR